MSSQLRDVIRNRGLKWHSYEEVYLPRSNDKVVNVNDQLYLKKHGIGIATLALQALLFLSQRGVLWRGNGSVS